MQKLKKKIIKYPSDNISINRNGKYIKLFITNDKGRFYLKKSKNMIAQKLIEKKYISEQIKDIEQELTAIGKYLEHHTDVKKSDKLITDFPDIKNLLQPYWSSENTKISKWLSKDYKTNPSNPEQLNIDTKSGNKVRSKSESIIDMVLYNNKLPYKYECELNLCDTTVYPDFTIMNPKNGKIVYWEHFGMMDNSTYYQKAYTKLMQYAANNIIPTINLIVTYETSKHPLSITEVEKVVDNYFN